MNDYAEEELQAVKYYIGDVQDMPQDGFWNDPKAYNLLNALFFEGIETETARIREGKFLNPEILADVSRLAYVLQNLFHAFRKSEREYLTYRVERYSDFLMMNRKKETISFTSTSCGGFLNAYRDRKGIALLRIRIPENTYCIVMQEIFEQYAKPEEEEILLPPWTAFQAEMLALSEQERNISDSDNQPPKLSCQLTLSGWKSHSLLETEIPDSGNLAGIRVITALTNGKIPEKQDILHYCAWKKAFTAKFF